MQNNPGGPYDDVFNNLARIVEDIVKSMPESQHARIIGYTIITRQADSGDPEVFRLNSPEDDGEVPYEVVETDNELFITAELPSDLKNAPFADIETQCVRIIADDRITTIMLDGPIDRIHSYYRVHRGIMDISLRKIRHL
ncbi:hypothetical protein [Methanoregula sp.]|uniref:hypothetical protein n=1 Tax=Methanoregula sp. TaxID=2052170 RepID=UPI0026077EF0|nr:hypothetical protein [Methanoregula sp.]MDD5142850.1 hypothetical protein [Methanoregula sp.]